MCRGLRYGVDLSVLLTGDVGHLPWPVLHLQSAPTSERLRPVSWGRVGPPGRLCPLQRAGPAVSAVMHCVVCSKPRAHAPVSPASSSAWQTTPNPQQGSWPPSWSHPPTPTEGQRRDHSATLRTDGGKGREGPGSLSLSPAERETQGPGLRSRLRKTISVGVGGLVREATPSRQRDQSRWKSVGGKQAPRRPDGQSLSSCGVDVTS